MPREIAGFTILSPVRLPFRHTGNDLFTIAYDFMPVRPVLPVLVSTRSWARVQIVILTPLVFQRYPTGASRRFEDYGFGMEVLRAT